ncbi:formate dehydrogenase accessory sulfurtransferase FdhD [Tissierella creatinophila]|uniref:Sulfur carrier protein FdhD n=1 Tax=Tissierella creatinophila DSM 6911 TaxID=1123403 RepID=A0A1U7M952_TISCR|nr:formate dehydrogenase accessory sulfurtransferase FdhD [Tissierella creatinophila]OLS03739.1 protein FdhD [Tissierella creatinophila DSM 6911]
MNYTKEYEILRINKDCKSKEKDIVVVESPFTIFIDEKEIITLLCTPKSLEELLIGFIISEGFIESIDDIEKIRIDEKSSIGYVSLKRKNSFIEKFQGKRTITSGCGKGTVFYNVLDSFKSKKIANPLELDIELIKENMRDFNKRSKLFLETGGVHSCGLYDRSRMLIFEEDIGRHNALDKIVGKALKENIDLKDKMIFTSGRISSEILIKTAKREISTIISRSAPTSLAIDIAKELGINLIGFVRGEKLNIYTNIKNLIKE